jgi:hypothetical protein
MSLGLGAYIHMQTSRGPRIDTQGEITIDFRLEKDGTAKSLLINSTEISKGISVAELKGLIGEPNTIWTEGDNIDLVYVLKGEVYYFSFLANKKANIKLIPPTINVRDSILEKIWAIGGY